MFIKIRWMRRAIVATLIAVLIAGGVQSAPAKAAINRVSGYAAPTGDQTTPKTKIGDKQIKQVALLPEEGYAILIGANGYSTFGSPKAFNTKLEELNTDNQDIKAVAVAPDMGWVILYGLNGYWLDGVSQELSDKLKELNADKSEIISVSFGRDGSWIVLFDDYGYSSVGMPKDLISSLKELNKSKKMIKHIAFDPTGLSAVIFGSNGFYFSDGLPQKAIDTLTDYNTKDYELLSIAFEANEAWVIVSDKELAWGGISKKLSDKIKALVKEDS